MVIFWDGVNRPQLPLEEAVAVDLSVWLGFRVEWGVEVDVAFGSGLSLKVSVKQAETSSTRDKKNTLSPARAGLKGSLCNPSLSDLSVFPQERCQTTP